MKYIMILIVGLLFGLCIYEFGKPGGALDHSLGITKEEIQNERNR